MQGRAGESLPLHEKTLVGVEQELEREDADAGRRRRKQRSEKRRRAGRPKRGRS
jgi:hypothetical protein